MPKRKTRKGAGESGRSGAFWPDRVVGGLEVAFGAGGAAMLLLVAVTGAGLSALEGSSAPPLSLRLLCVGAAVLSALHLWAGVHLFRGRRLGFAAVAALLVLAPYVTGLAVARGWLGKSSPIASVQSGWTTALLLFCIARLGGWGPKPS